jgi:hypothetical protein
MCPFNYWFALGRTVTRQRCPLPWGRGLFGGAVTSIAVVLVLFDFHSVSNIQRPVGRLNISQFDTIFEYRAFLIERIAVKFE